MYRWDVTTLPVHTIQNVSSSIFILGNCIILFVMCKIDQMQNASEMCLDLLTVYGL